MIENLVDFIRGPGFVLDFSDRSFADFFASELKINIDDPITHQDANGYPMNGWRHAGCIGPQAFTTRYKQAEKMTDDFLGHSEGPEAPSS